MIGKAVGGRGNCIREYDNRISGAVAAKNEKERGKKKILIHLHSYIITCKKNKIRKQNKKQETVLL